MVKYIILDFDGTLADGSSLVAKILNGLSSRYGFKHFKSEDLEYLKSLPSTEIVKKIGIPKWKLPFLLYSVRAAMRKDVDQLKLSHPDIKEVLSAIRKHDGIKLGILSSNSKDSIEEFVKKQGIDYFDFIHTINSLWGKEKKFKKLEKAGVINIGESIYIGDETRDIISCKKAGLKCIAVTWGYNSKEILEKFDPEYLLKNPFELLEILKKENSNKA